ncbi:MAG: M55 family metallopeptidase [Candidatus Eiseniibacteriota bacterium]|jgi:D-amino peptidase
MKIFVSADIEGVTGIAHWDEATESKPDYAPFREQMTAEVRAACEAAVAAGATEILVKDAHGTGRNIVAAALPECARLSRGWSGHPFCMMDELDASYDAVLMVGYHARAGSGGSPMAHTMSGSVVSVFRLNGAPVAEFELNAMTAQSVDVPVVFVAGDASVCEQARRHAAAIETVATQHGHGRSTVSRHPAVSCRLIAEGVERALRGDPARCLAPLPERFEVEIEYHEATLAYGRSFYPGARLEDERRVRFEATDWFDVLRFIQFVI